MHILQFINSLRSGGAERFVVDLCNELVTNGNTVSLILFGGDNEVLYFNRQFLSPKVRIYTLDIPQKFSIQGILRFEHIIKQIKPDIVHGHLNVLPYIYISALLHRNIKFIHTLHNLADKCAPKIQRPIDRWFYRKNLINPIAISEKCKKSYIEYFGIDNAPAIDNGRSVVHPTNKLDKVRKEISTFMPKNKEVPVFINVARFNSQKNHNMLVSAFNKIHETHPDSFVLLIIGNHFFDNVEAERLRNMASPNIHFLGEKNNPGDYLLCSDYFCLSSNFEGLPISLLEAISCGVTPICTPVGGIPDVIEDGKTGFLSTGISEEEYIYTIERALTIKIPKTDLQQLYNNRFSMSACCDKYIAQYTK